MASSVTPSVVETTAESNIYNIIHLNLVLNHLHQSDEHGERVFLRTRFIFLDSDENSR